ncbi:MAG: hypothetical protein GW836_17110 [Paraglaciecola sp.]|nr:hypothetical protein [Paraglaciecola sp.]
MQIKNNALSLFDYIGNYAKTEQAFERGINNQKRDVAADLRSLQQDIALDKVDETLKRLQSGEQGMSINTLNNMLNFSLAPISKDLQNVAAGIGIVGKVELKKMEGKWAVTSELAADNSNIKQLQAYIDRNAKLNTKLDNLSKLSAMYELGLSQNYAKQLQEAGVSEPEVVSYLTQSREYLYGLERFKLNAGGLSPTSRGEADTLFSAIKETLGLTDEKG